MKRWGSFVGAFILGLVVCNSSYGFEWLDRLIGIDLDNSEAQAAGPGQAYGPYTASYAPNSAGYPAPAGPGCGSCGCAPKCGCAPRCGCAPQACYRTVYQPVAVTSYQPVATCDPCGRRVTTMRPVVTYRMQAQVVSYNAAPAPPAFPPPAPYPVARGARYGY